MKKIYAFLLGLLLAILTIYVVKLTYIPIIENYYKRNDNSIRYSDSTDKDMNRDILISNINDNTLVLMGSSELIVNRDKGYQPKNYFNYEDFNIMQIGGYHSQNIVHASILSSIGEFITSKKLVIIESIQWFDKQGMKPYIAVDKISKEHVYYALKNPLLSKDTKIKLIDRIISLSWPNRNLVELYQSYKERYLNPDKNNFINSLDIYLNSISVKNRFFKTGIKELIPIKPGNTLSYNWSALKEEEADKQAAISDNNSFGIDNDYFNKNLKNKLEKLKSSQTNLTYSDSSSPEYSDMELFLQIASELGIEVEVIIQPVNGYWYDYIGFDKEKRAEAYNKIQKIAEKYQVKYVNYADKEYEPQFMYDIMHFGAKGWLDVSENIFDFYKN